VELGPLLDGLVAEVRPGLAERAVRLEYASPNGARCAADPGHLAYALRAVLEGVAHEVPAHDALEIDAATPGRLRIAFDPRGGTAERLKRIVLAEQLPDVDADSMLPLALVLARAVLERNGGALALASQPDGRALLDIRLRTARAAGGG
jgi:hypothetical protein